MFREKLPARQLGAWIFAAITPVLLQLLGGASWLPVAAAGGAGLILSLWRWRTGWEPCRWQAVLTLIYTIIITGTLLRQCDESWPVGSSYPAVPLIVLGLAAWSAQKGPSAAARVGGVLYWVVLLMYLVVLGAGVRDVRLQWLMPRLEMPDALGLLPLLIPCGTACLLRPGGGGRGKLVMPVIFAVEAALIVGGVLSVPVAQRTANAFYEMSRSISLGGVAKRFEALVSAGMTLGWFALTSLLLTACGVLIQCFLPGWGKPGVWISGAMTALWMLCGLHIQGWALICAGAIFWVLIPVLAQGLERIKKSKKSENNA